MSRIVEIVDSLESSLDALLKRYDDLKEKQVQLERELANLRNQQQKDQEQIDVWKQRFESLKMANSMLGSDQYKRDTKLKINALIREIDQCIAQLSE